MKRTVLLTLLATLLLAAGCDAKKDGAKAEESGNDEAKPAPLVDVSIEIEKGMVTPAVTVTTKLPEDWKKDEFFKGVWMPPESPSAMEVGMRIEANCGGECAAEKIAANIDAEIAGVAERWTQGTEAHLKPTIETIEKGDLPSGKFHAYRMSYPPAPEGAASGRPSTRVECYLHNEGDAFYVHIEGTARPKMEGHIWPTVLDACKMAKHVTK